MHGSRQRLDASLASHPICSKIRRWVGTIDGFALQLVNQWRSSLGLGMPACAVKSAPDSGVESVFGVQFSYERVVSMATTLLQHPLVRATLANTHPLVIVDEFQDCTGERLRLISELSSFISVIAAADPFQHLDCGEDHRKRIVAGPAEVSVASPPQGSGGSRKELRWRGLSCQAECQIVK